MPDEHYDPFDTGSQASESQPDAEDHSTLPEADEPETYGLGKSIELPELRPPPRPVIEPLEEREENQPPEETSLNLRRRQKLIEGEDPLVGDTLVSAMWYPLSGQGIRVLGLYTLLFWLVPNVPIPGVREILLLAIYGYVGLLFLESAKFALDRIPLGPRLPDLNLEDIQTGLYALIVVLISGVPYFLTLSPIVSALISTPMSRLLLMIAGVFCSLFYIPMGFLVLADLENESALNPLVVFRGIGKMIGPYFGLFSLAAVSYVIPLFVMMRSDIHWVLVGLIRSFLLIYLFIALMRAVAIVFRDRGIDLAQSE